MQPLLLFFVDAASVIDQEDGDWDLLLAVLQQECSPQIVIALPFLLIVSPAPGCWCY